MKIVLDKSIIEISDFCPQQGGVKEYHIMVHATNIEESFAEQLAAIMDGFFSLYDSCLVGAETIFRRFYLSDAANQNSLLSAYLFDQAYGAVSIIEQAPLDGSKIAMYVYAATDFTVESVSATVTKVSHGAYNHIWLSGATNNSSNSEYQMRKIFNKYIVKLAEQGCTLANNCIRTWIYVQNVDVNYMGAVKARNEVFFTQGLTDKTHFIASTGIGGRHADPARLVVMDAYAIDGIVDGQVKYLYAPSHLNPTYEYGVSFERGSYVDFGDRRTVYISGTASINNLGEVVYPGDVKRQALRAIENVEVLLAEADCTYDNVQQMVVYLRDMSDYMAVKAIYEQRFPEIPKVFVLAPVCRAAWLVEMECIASKSQSLDNYPVL